MLDARALLLYANRTRDGVIRETVALKYRPLPSPVRFVFRQKNPGRTFTFRVVPRVMLIIFFYVRSEIVKYISRDMASGAGKENVFIFVLYSPFTMLNFRL